MREAWSGAKATPPEKTDGPGGVWVVKSSAAELSLQLEGNLHFNNANRQHRLPGDKTAFFIFLLLKNLSQLPQAAPNAGMHTQTVSKTQRLGIYSYTDWHADWPGLTLGTGGGTREGRAEKMR